MGGVCEVYGRCMVPVSQHLTWLRGLCTKAIRKIMWGLGLFCVSSPKNEYATRAKFPRHKHQVCPREASCSHGGSAPLPCHKTLSSLPQDAIFFATNIYLPCHKRPSCVVQDHRRKNRETNSGEGWLVAALKICQDLNENLLKTGRYRDFV